MFCCHFIMFIIHGRRGLGITCVRSYCLIYHNKMLLHYTVLCDNLGFVLQCFNYISKGLAIFSREAGVTKFINRIQEYFSHIYFLASLKSIFFFTIKFCRQIKQISLMKVKRPFLKSSLCRLKDPRIVK